MNVAELIEELKKFPPHYPILCDVGLKYDQSIKYLDQRLVKMGVGPVVVIRTEDDPRNARDCGSEI